MWKYIQHMIPSYWGFHNIFRGKSKWCEGKFFPASLIMELCRSHIRESGHERVKLDHLILFWRIVLKVTILSRYIFPKWKYQWCSSFYPEITNGFLISKSGIFGVSHHDQLFTQEAVNVSTAEYNEAIDAQVIPQPFNTWW